jgi:NADPH:quinone reductase
MKAVVAHSFGPIEALAVEELPDPVVGPGQVLIDVAAAGVNYPDLLVVTGKYQILPKPPFIPGKEAAGVVRAIGSGVETCAVGDRVMTLVENGAYCQRLLAPAANCFVIPESMGMIEAAAFGLTLQTAYFALVVRAGLKSGETVLVTGAAGGVGLACVQLARALGATVIAGVSSPEKAEVARAAGANHVIDLSGEGLRDRIRQDVYARNGGKGADVICEVVGGDVFDGCLRALAWSGRIVLLGFAGGRIPSIPANYVLIKNITVTGLHWSDYREWHPELMRKGQEILFELYRKGLLSQKVTVAYPVTQVSEAMRQLRDRLVKGKVVLTMPE